MKVFRLEKRLNNAELGKGNVHETYVRIPNGSDAHSIFENVGEKYTFIDEQTGNSAMSKISKHTSSSII